LNREGITVIQFSEKAEQKESESLEFEKVSKNLAKSESKEEIKEKKAKFKKGLASKTKEELKQPGIIKASYSPDGRSKRKM